MARKTGLKLFRTPVKFKIGSWDAPGSFTKIKILAGRVRIIFFAPKTKSSVVGMKSAFVARKTGLEPATSAVTGRRSNQLSYSRVRAGRF